MAIRQPSISVSGLVAQAEQATRLIADQWAELLDSPQRTADFSQAMARAAQWTEDRCRRQGGDPAALKVRAWQAYAWLRYVGGPQRLAALAASTQRAHQAAADLAAETENAKRPVRVEWSVQRSLFRSRKLGAGPPLHARTGSESARPAWVLRLSIGFVAAPAAVLSAIWRSAWRLTGDRARMRYEHFARSADYRQVIAQLTALAGVRRREVLGCTHDLEQIRAELIRTCFADMTDPPAVAWSLNLPRRLLGRYDPVEQAITLNSCLDDPAVPAQAVAYVLYHELLHHHRPAQWHHGRLVAHDRRFRNAEHQFPAAQQWDQWLNAWLTRCRRQRRRS